MFTQGNLKGALTTVVTLIYGREFPAIYDQQKMMVRARDP